MLSDALGGHVIWKIASVRFGGKSPAIAASLHSFRAPGFTLDQVYLTKLLVLRVLEN